jgi:hypothetical protein
MVLLVARFGSDTVHDASFDGPLQLMRLVFSYTINERTGARRLPCPLVRRLPIVCFVSLRTRNG